MFNLNAMKEIEKEFIGKEVWVIANKRKINRNGQIYSKSNELEVYPGTIQSIRISDFTYLPGEHGLEWYPAAEANVTMRCNMDKAGEETKYYVNGGHFMLNITCFDSEAAARNEMALMQTRDRHEQLVIASKQML